jgi:hypothetical protein
VTRVVNDEDLAQLLAQIEPGGRDVLRRAMRAEQWERDEFSDALARQGSTVGKDLADLLDLASINPRVRQQVARVLAAVDARS